MRVAALNSRASIPLAPAESENFAPGRTETIRLAAPRGGRGTQDQARLMPETETYRLILSGQGSEPLPCPLINWFLTGHKPHYYLNFPKPSEERAMLVVQPKVTVVFKFVAVKVFLFL